MERIQEPSLAELWSHVDGGWRAALPNALESFEGIEEFLAGERASGKQVLPPRGDTFRAFELTPLNSVKAVVLAQDPYPTPGLAHGLSFSVLPGIEVPASLKNIYAELEKEVEFTRPGHGDLEAWARRGILLLNSALTVRAGEPKSHVGKGWETFTDDVISVLGARSQTTVFFLWGGDAKKKAALIAGGAHLVICKSHPSNQGAWQGFRDSGQFREADDFLARRGLDPIDWTLPETVEQPEAAGGGGPAEGVLRAGIRSRTLESAGAGCP